MAHAAAMYLSTHPIQQAARPMPAEGPARVLVVDGDPTSAADLVQLLGAFGMTAEVAGTAQAAEARLLVAPADLIVTEVELPDEDGLGLCRRVSRQGETPILVLSRRCEVMDRIIGLEYGADDYLAKTAHPLEVVARVKALLRRPRTAAPPPRPEGPQADWNLHAGERRLQAPDGRGVRLSATEFRFLQALFPRRGEMLARAEIAQAVYGGAAPQPRSIDVLASRVRRKLLGLTGRDMIGCVRGAGYVLEAWPSHGGRPSSTGVGFAAQ